MSAPDVRITDTRTVRINTSGPARENRPRLCTPAGRSPIAVDRVELCYDLPTRRLNGVTVWGYLIDERDIERRRQAFRGRGRSSGEQIITRRVPIDWRTHEPEADVPEWLRGYIEEHRP
jgi:hypothetical protein